MRPTVAAIALLSAVAAGAHAQVISNLLGNAGFEDPIVYEGDPPASGNWFAFFGGSAEAPVLSENPYAGDDHLRLQLDAPQSFVGVFQNVLDVQAGETYLFGAYIAGLSATDIVEVRIEWYGADGLPIGVPPNPQITLQSELDSEYDFFSFTAVAPEGVARATVVLGMQSYDDDVSGSIVDFDNAVFGVVPTPGTAGLLGAAGLLALRRRR